MHYHWEQTAAKKRKVTTLNSVHQDQSNFDKKIATVTVVGQKESSAIDIASSRSCEPKRFVRKVEKQYIQE